MESGEKFSDSNSADNRNQDDKSSSTTSKPLGHPTTGFVKQKITAVCSLFLYIIYSFRFYLYFSYFSLRVIMQCSLIMISLFYCGIFIIIMPLVV